LSIIKSNLCIFKCETAYLLLKVGCDETIMCLRLELKNKGAKKGHQF